MGNCKISYICTLFCILLKPTNNYNKKDKEMSITKINITGYALDDINLLVDRDKCKKFLKEKYENLKDKDFYLNITKTYYLKYKTDICCDEYMDDNWTYCPYCGERLRDVEIECETLEAMKQSLKEENLSLSFIDEVEIRYNANIEIKDK